MHRILLSTLLIDAPSDHYQQTTQFWAGALNADVVHPRGMDDYRILHGASDDFRVVVQNVHSGQAGVHLDIHTDDLAAEVERLVGLGATVVDDSNATHPGQWVIMADPAGKQFCVVYALNPRRSQEDRDAFERRARPVG
ncbi:VOC family protein [Mycobacterium sp. AMU20-3851]|uniref:VOC family protein n=1 Tax=Mycobacterium sp. AMU20-3851 TaxID=3122055 RepID=UPI00375425FA